MGRHERGMETGSVCAGSAGDTLTDFVQGEEAVFSPLGGFIRLTAQRGIDFSAVYLKSVSQAVADCEQICNPRYAKGMMPILRLDVFVCRCVDACCL